MRGPAAPADRALRDALGVEHELGEVRLAARQVPVVLQLRILVDVGEAVGVHEAVAERIHDPGAHHGSRVSRIDVGLDFQVEDARDRRRVGFLVGGDRVGDGHALHALEVPGQVLRLGSPGLEVAAQHVPERLLLRRGRLLVEVDDHPVQVGLLAEAAADDDPVQAGHVDGADVALVDVHGVGVVAAVALHRLLIDAARAGGPAAAADDARTGHLERGGLSLGRRLLAGAAAGQQDQHGNQSLRHSFSSLSKNL